MISGLYEKLWKTPGLKTLGRLIHNHRRFTTERGLLRGVAVTARQDLPSLAFFTVHKAASIFAAAVCRRIAEHSGYVGADFMSYAFSGGRVTGELFQPGQLTDAIYRKKGFFYGPFRHFHEGIPWLAEGRVILHVRDPRDVLVSGYYSLAYSHYVPSVENPDKAAQILDARQRALSKGIDDHVLENAEGIRLLYQKYADSLLSVPSTHLSRYESMVHDFRAWLDEISSSMGLAPSSGFLGNIAAETSFQVSEDATRHKRQVTPGDYVRKLEAGTIRELNRTLGSVLATYGYRS